MTQINKSNVMSVYSGRPGCCCGCRGKHSYAKAYQQLGSESRGYEVEDSDVNDEMVTRVVNIINANLDKAEQAAGHIAFETDSRLYVAYLAS